MSVADEKFSPRQETETDMENLTYQTYLANPAVREQIEREVRRARAEAVHEYIAMPVARIFSWIFRRPQPKPVASLQMSA
jgi:hypothetical protein